MPELENDLAACGMNPIGHRTPGRDLRCVMDAGRAGLTHGFLGDLARFGDEQADRARTRSNAADPFSITALLSERILRRATYEAVT